MSLFQVLDPKGVLIGECPVDDDTLVEMYRHMIRTRAFDERALALQRTGRLPAYYQCAGQEGHVGAAMATEPTDWILPAYREQGMRLARGVSVYEELAVWKGRPDLAWDPVEHRVGPVTATIGTHLPHATGLGYANRILDTNTVTMAVFGDGATSEGDFHAALNSAGVWRTATVFLCQNNQVAQSTPIARQTATETLAEKAGAYGIPGVRVDGMDVLAMYAATRSAVDRARAGNGPTLIEALLYRYGAHSTYDGVPGYRTREEEAEWAARDPLIRMAALLTERGLIDESFETAVRAEIRAEVDQALDLIESAPLPDRMSTIDHLHSTPPPRLVRQVSEQGVIAGEPPFDVTAERPIEHPSGGETKAMTTVEAINAALDHRMRTDVATVILGEDVAHEGGVFRVTAGLLEKYGADRVIDTPLNELGIVGSAVGMAIAGLRPVCEIEFAGFMNTAFDQIAFHVARYRWRTGGRVSMPMVVRMPAGGGHQGFEGHSDAPENLFVHTPGLRVVYPSNARDAKGLMASALAGDDPVIFFEPIVRYFVREEGVPVDDYRVPIGLAAVARPGSDITVAAYGNAVGAALEAADMLAQEGIYLEVIDLRTLAPLDEETVFESVTKTGRLVVAHEAPITGGFGAELVATVTETIGDRLETPPVRVGHADTIWNPSLLEVYSLVGPERIVAAVRKVLVD